MSFFSLLCLSCWLLLLVGEAKINDCAALEHASGASGIADIEAAILLAAPIILILAIDFGVRVPLEGEPIATRQLGERCRLAMVDVFDVCFHCCCFRCSLLLLRTHRDHLDVAREKFVAEARSLAEKCFERLRRVEHQRECLDVGERDAPSCLIDAADLLSVDDEEKRFGAFACGVRVAQSVGAVIAFSDEAFPSIHLR